MSTLLSMEKQNALCMKQIGSYSKRHRNADFSKFGTNQNSKHRSIRQNNPEKVAYLHSDGILYVNRISYHTKTK